MCLFFFSHLFRFIPVCLCVGCLIWLEWQYTMKWIHRWDWELFLSGAGGQQGSGWFSFSQIVFSWMLLGMKKQKTKLDLLSKSKSSTSGWLIQIYALGISSIMNHTPKSGLFILPLSPGKSECKYELTFFVVETQQRLPHIQIVLPRWRISCDLKMRRLHMGASFIVAFLFVCLFSRDILFIT